MKSRDELRDVIDQITSTDSPVGMDVVYIHAAILDRLTHIEQRLSQMEQTLGDRSSDEPS